MEMNQYPGELTDQEIASAAGGSSREFHDQCREEVMRYRQQLRGKNLNWSDSVSAKHVCDYLENAHLQSNGLELLEKALYYAKKISDTDVRTEAVGNITRWIEIYKR